jgi:ParB/RepB/Spo0J family partition protein
MNELAQSIKEQGVIVPVKVRPVDDAPICSRHGWPGNVDCIACTRMADWLYGPEYVDTEGYTAGSWEDHIEGKKPKRKPYELIYGHRRVEAARRAGLDEIPAIVEGVDDTDALVQALIENVQREDMNDMDKARALNLLVEETGWNLAEIERQGIFSDAYAKRLLGLLEEEEETQNLLAEGKITTYHAARVREAGVQPQDRTQVLRKASNERLTADQTRRVAESVAAAPSEEAKKKILDWEYSPALHNPERIKSRAERYGAHDTLYREKQPPKDENWREAPEVSAIIDGLKEQRRLLKEYRKTAEVGKMSPEARRFIARRVRNYAESLMNWADNLEGNDV